MTEPYHRIQKINQRKSQYFTQSFDQVTWVNYMIEAMKPVDEKLTQNLLVQANYLENLLRAQLMAYDLNVGIMRVGSIVYNTHISSTSTVDLILIHNGFENNQKNTNATALEPVKKLKDITLKILQKKFPEVLGTNSHNLHYKMSCPSWLCNFQLYFASRKFDNHRDNTSGISSEYLQILNKHTLKFVQLNPNLAFNQLAKKDKNTNSNAKMLIRVLKNLVLDADDTIPLSGYQITSIVYSMDDYTLMKPRGQIILMLLECLLFVKRLCNEPFLRLSLKHPGNAPVITPNNDALFLVGCTRLNNELEDVIKQLVLEMDVYQNIAEKIKETPIK